MSAKFQDPVAIVGGGLVGALLAALLVRRGHAVTVYERRPDFREHAASAGGRSINLVLTRRGIRALERVGLAEGAMALTVRVIGRMVHALDGRLVFQPYGRDATECNHSISRSGLNRFLVDAAGQRGARFRFGARLVGADPWAGRLTFEDEIAGGTFEVESPVVFAADGAGSVLRDAMRAGGGFEESFEKLSHGYKELTIPPASDGGFLAAADALHIWPRGALMLMALPNLDGTFTATLYLPWEGEHGFAALTAPEKVEGLFREQFPDAVALIPRLTEEFFDHPTGSLGTLRCAPYHVGGRALLIGDAAHPIVPFFGQGMNTGFEDCRVLDDLLDAHGDEAWDRVFAEFTRLRKPNADAIADMALENFVEMRDRVGDARFVLRKSVEHRLEQNMPKVYRSRYSMVMYSHIPFRLAYEAGRLQHELLDEFCDGLGRAEDLDLAAARRAIDERLTPFLEGHGISLDY